MHRLAAAFAAILTLPLLATAQAAPALQSTTDYATYNVRGSTPAEILAYMNRHPIIDPDDGPSYANITHRHDLEVGTLAGDKMCTVNKLRFTWHFLITTPVAIDKLSPKTATLWRNFERALTAHEEHHRAIFLDCGQDFVAAAAKLTGPPTCTGLERDVRDFIDIAYDACMERQREFDAKDHSHIMATPFMTEAQLGD